MYLHTSSRPTEVPDFDPEHLEDTLRSIEQKKQKLEEDIAQYIREKQEVLQNYENEVISKNRKPPATTSGSDNNAETLPDKEDKTAVMSERIAETLDESTSSRPERFEDAARQSKPTRVHKREKELEGLIAFLPLLDQNDPLEAKKKKKHRLKSKDRKLDLGGRTDSGNSTSSTGESSSANSSSQHSENATSDPMGPSESRPAPERVDSIGSESARSETSDAGSEFKSKRPSTKKSSLRHNATKSRRKRVSIVIDDQIVHPSDNIIAAEDLISPPSETADESGSSSTSSIRSPADPFKFSTSVYGEHEHLNPETPLSLPAAVEATSAILANSPPQLEYEAPPKVISHTVPITSPTKPLTSADDKEAKEDNEKDNNLETERTVPRSTYVGSISGNSVDNINQSGSYGYPSSLGASYLESYMASRPLSVRMKAAEKAELKEAEAKKLVQGDTDREVPSTRTNLEAKEDGGRSRQTYTEDDTVEEIIGSMEEF